MFHDAVMFGDVYILLGNGDVILYASRIYL